jgi:putative aldouronate transport system substrate-binding protein
MINLSRKRFCLMVLCLICSGMALFATGSNQSGPAAGGKPTLQIAVQSNSNVTDFEDNYLTRYVENLHNIKLDFYYLPQDGNDSRAKINAMAAANDLPETIWGGSINSAMALELGDQGFLKSLNTYFADASKTPNFNKIPQADRTKMLRDTRSSDGNNYSFPRYQQETWNYTPFRYYINRSWLTKLNLQVPTTTDELRNVLIAFRDRDPNGNGRQDEIGVFGWAGGGYGQNVIQALINSFVYYNGNLALDASGNNVVSPVTDAGFRRALQYLNGLFRDKLLDPSTFTVDEQTFRATLNANPMVVGLTSMGSNSNFQGYTPVDNNPNYRAMAPLIGPFSSPNCPGYTPYNEPNAELRTYITNKAKNVDLAVKVMDSFYDQTLSLIVRFGEEGVDWSRDPAILARNSNPYVALGLYPRLTLVQLIEIWSRPSNKIWGDGAMLRYATLEMGNTIGSEENKFNPDSPAAMQNGYNYQYMIPRHPQYILPNLQWSATDNPVQAPISSNVSTYVSQSIAEFTIGTRDINSDAAWNAYVTQLNNMGLQQLVSLAQAQYNRQK